jgi:hypothetical protein
MAEEEKKEKRTKRLLWAPSLLSSADGFRLVDSDPKQSLSRCSGRRDATQLRLILSPLLSRERPAPIKKALADSCFVYFSDRARRVGRSALYRQKGGRDDFEEVAREFQNVGRPHQQSQRVVSEGNKSIHGR